MQHAGHIGRFLLGYKLHQERHHVSLVSHMLGSRLGREEARIYKPGDEAGLLHRRHILLLGREQNLRQRLDVLDPRDGDWRLDRIGLGARSVGFAGDSLLEGQRRSILAPAARDGAKRKERGHKEHKRPHRRDGTRAG